MGEEIEACPECNSSNVYDRISKTPTYRCNSCENTFEDPLMREKISNIDRDVLEAVRDYCSENNTIHFKSAQLVEYTEYNTHQLGQSLGKLKRCGFLSEWGGTHRTSWQYEGK